ncbi:MAG: pilus assembly protein PilZ [Pseudomonadota bacterium]
MKTLPDHPQTSPETEKHATEEVTLPRIAVIGIFGSEAAPRALIRSPNGKITRVEVGDKAAGGIVTAIGADSVVIARRGGATVLALPRG